MPIVVDPYVLFPGNIRFLDYFPCSPLAHKIGEFRFVVGCVVSRSRPPRYDEAFCAFCCSILSVLVAGLNNSYQVNAQTELALRYNDQSVLENHHCASCFAILSRPECNILSGLKPAQQKVCSAHRLL